jgi:hypothetical protein
MDFDDRETARLWRVYKTVHELVMDRVISFFYKPLHKILFYIFFYEKKIYNNLTLPRDMSLVKMNWNFL